MRIYSPPPPFAASYCYLPSGWDVAWKIAKAKAASQRVSIVGIGDSIMQGWSAADFMVDAWWAKLRTTILAGNNQALGGDHYGMMYSAAYQTNLGGPTTATPPLVVNGVWGTDYVPYYGGFGLSPALQNALSPFITCTPPYNVVGFDIVYVDFGTGYFTYQVDSGSTVQVNCTGPWTLVGSAVKKISITGLTSGVHTLKINWDGNAGVNLVIPCGVTAYAANNGFCFANLAVPGCGLYAGLSTENALASTARFPVDKLGLFQGYQGATATPTALTGLGFPAQPDLAIIGLGVNDAAEGVSRGNFRDTLDRLVWSLRYGKNDACSVLLMAMYNADGTVASSTAVPNTDCTANGATAYRDIRAAMIEVAQVENCALVDVHGAFGRTPVTNGWVTSASDEHPTSGGHAKIANLLAPLV